MKSISIADLAAATAGRIVSQGSRAVTAGLTTDSRAVAPGSIFLALCGERFDGNNFAAAASQQAAAVVVSRLSGEYAADCSVILVDDTLEALQALARRWRTELEPLHVVGLTGSSGKTSTKDMCLAVVSQKYEAIATKGNLNKAEARIDAERRKKQHDLEKAQALANEIKGKQLNLKVKTGESGRLFGAITSKDLAAEIKKQLGYEIDRKKIVADTIKATGLHEAEIKLYPEVSAKLKIMVEAE